MIGKVIQDYRIDRLIGQGGMGDVYLAAHTLIGKKAAIKVLKADFLNNETVKARFINEAKALSELSHSNIVTLYNFTYDSNTFYMIMEYAEGVPLDNYVGKLNGPIEEKRGISIFIRILDAFSYAHKCGIIHRDIKPSNIILCRDDIPKILDFGIAKMMKSDARITQTGTRMGSVAYMSPEQILGYAVDLRTDIFSLGVLLFEMLSGRLPYKVDTGNDYLLQEKIVREPMPSVKEFYPQISDKTAEIIKKATEKNIDDRFLSCKEFSEALSSVLSGSSDSVSKPSAEFIPVNNYISQTQNNVISPPVDNVSLNIQQPLQSPTEIITPEVQKQLHNTVPDNYTSPPPIVPKKRNSKTGVVVLIIILFIIAAVVITTSVLYFGNDGKEEVNTTDTVITNETKINTDSIENAGKEQKAVEKRIQDSVKQALLEDSIRNAENNFKIEEPKKTVTKTEPKTNRNSNQNNQTTRPPVREDHKQKKPPSKGPSDPK